MPITPGRTHFDEISNGRLEGYGVTAIQGKSTLPASACNNYGNADYDIRHSFNANYVWTEPYHFGNPILNAIVGGWLASENFIVRSGVPFTVTDGTGIYLQRRYGHAGAGDRIGTAKLQEWNQRVLQLCGFYQRGPSAQWSTTGVLPDTNSQPVPWAGILRLRFHRSIRISKSGSA